MTWLQALGYRFRHVFKRRSAEQELAEEIESHIEFQTQQNIDQGLTPEQARRAAHLKFGNSTLAREDSRAVWSFAWLETLGQDLRYGARSLAKSPGFTAGAVLSLALGIGGTSTIFSVISPILLRKPPVKDPDRVVLISIREPKLESGRDDASSWDSFYWPKASTFLAWREHNRVFEQMARSAGPWVTPNFFRLLGVEPILGRGFSQEDTTVDRAGNVRRFPIVISHRFWQRRFNGDPNVVGQTLRDDKQRVMEVIGVMPPGFWIKPWTYERDYWFPRDFSSAPSIPSWQRPFARLKPGVSIEQARANLEAIARPLEHPETAPDTGWMVEVQTIHEFTSGYLARSLYLLLGAVGLILLIGCGNVASLLLSRSAARYKEIATRAALGAGRRRLIRQLLTESMLLAMLGGLLGVLLTFAGIKLFIFLVPNFYPPSHEFRIDPTVLGFALGISMLTAILFGLVPALWASRLDLNTSLKEGARRSAAPPRHRASSVLVVSEVALALVLLIGAGLMINTFVRLQTEDLGYNPEGLLAAWISLEGPKYSKKTDGDTTTVSPEGTIFWQQLLKRIEARPGVTSAGTSRNAAPGRPKTPFRIIGRSDATMGERPLVYYNEIGGDYFKTLEIPLLKGRVFNERDTQGSLAVAIISETLARKHFPDEDPLGKVLQMDFQARVLGGSRLTPRDPAANDRKIIQDKPREIVGVVGSTTDKYWNFDRFSVVYVPYSQHPRVYPNPRAHTHLLQTLFVRTASDPAGLATAVREAVADLDKNLLSSTEIETHQAGRSWQFDTERFWVRLLGLFAGLAVFLAAVGLYGVISYSVTRRTHEFGLRIALGAHRASLLMLVLRQGLFLSLIGVAIGVAAALGLTRLLATQLYGITPTDPATFAVVSLVLIAVAMLASYIPARRATKVDPMVALRHE